MMSLFKHNREEFKQITFQKCCNSTILSFRVRIMNIYCQVQDVEYHVEKIVLRIQQLTEKQQQKVINSDNGRL